MDIFIKIHSAIAIKLQTLEIIKVQKLEKNYLKIQAP